MADGSCTSVVPSSVCAARYSVDPVSFFMRDRETAFFLVAPDSAACRRSEAAEFGPSPFTLTSFLPRLLFLPDGTTGDSSASPFAGVREVWCGRGLAAGDTCGRTGYEGLDVRRASAAESGPQAGFKRAQSEPQAAFSDHPVAVCVATL